MDYSLLVPKFKLEANQLLQQPLNIDGALNNFVNESEIVSGIWSSLPQPAVDGITFLFNIAKIAGILFIAYLVFLLIKTLYTMRQAGRLKSIEQNVKEINERLAHFIERGKKYKEEKDKK